MSERFAPLESVFTAENRVGEPAFLVEVSSYDLPH